MLSFDGDDNIRNSETEGESSSTQRAIYQSSSKSGQSTSVVDNDIPIAHNQEDDDDDDAVSDSDSDVQQVTNNNTHRSMPNLGTDVRNSVPCYQTSFSRSSKIGTINLENSDCPQFGDRSIYEKCKVTINQFNPLGETNKSQDGKNGKTL